MLMSKDISVEKKNFPFSNKISTWFKDIEMKYIAGISKAYIPILVTIAILFLL